MNIISNCPLCEKHSLHVINNNTLLQCLNCGYASTDKFATGGKDNEEYKKLPEDMQRWSKDFNGRIWVPSIMTLPEGMLYPIEKENDEFDWAYAEMVDIPEDDKENYPDDNGGFYDKRYDTENFILYDTFFEAMLTLNEKAKEASEDNTEQKELKLPKLKKII